ncbi:hypothetical protein A1O7_08031 [Cladophialophora yegresii CBS 114405]|uniref:Transcription factor domain-containing protein n=1 Tax=Cladophialophora yegresii CBS 114405 TaxID=1182544 RepID=W9VSF0_9EURO|nr:uncharacterized protein A1O7_08031 [Cladophialophora yegresii CBS 114405]EXJ55106.1 hypothetical protein A1O7_08031 [Cladophialophora yegresii CBS 114405]
MSELAKRSSGSESPNTQCRNDTPSLRRRATPSPNHEPENRYDRRFATGLVAAMGSKTPSPNIMFVPMSSEPGRRAKIRPDLRASAKAHVMYDYKRRTAEKRLAEWKMSTPKTYSLGPKEPLVEAPAFSPPTSVPEQVLSWQVVEFQTKEIQSKLEAKTSSKKTTQCERTGHSSQQISSPSSLQPSAATVFDSERAPIFTQPRGSSLLDVFYALPIQVQPWDETLVIRWLHYDRIPWCPVNGQSQWIPFVTQSPVLIHTNLYCWGMHWHGKLTGTDQRIFLSQNPRILEHKIVAIQMINASLESQPTVSDEILAAVAIFINVSLQFLNRDEAAKHMVGLETLLRLRGGLESLSRMGTIGVLLQRMISWNDLFFVELFGGDLRFSLLPRWEEAWKAVYEPLIADPVTHLEPLQARFAGDPAYEIMSVLREMQVVCYDILARPLETLTAAEKTLRHDNLFRFERRLCLATRITSMPHRTQIGPQENNNSLWRAVAYAALMYVHHHMRPGYALHLAQFRALSVQLRGELFSTNAESWDAAPALHLWVLAVGSWVSQREDWILNMLAEACRMRKCVTWNRFETMIKLCPNLGPADDERSRIVWEAVARLL